MCALVDFWNALNLTSTSANAFFALLFTWVGYRAGVSWSRAQADRDRLAERKSLFDSIDFFVADCVMTLRDGAKELQLSRPPHRPVPVGGIEYFQVQAMRHSEHDVFVALATLRAQADQANTLFPVVVDRFTSAPEQSLASPERPSILQLHCRYILNCYEEVRKAAAEVVKVTDASRKRGSR